MSDFQATYERLTEHAVQTAQLGSTASLLHWDERTQMPTAAAAWRAEQVTQLAGLIHQRQTDPQVGDWLDALSESPLAADPHGDSGAVIRGLRRDYDRQTKLPQRLVEQLARTSILGQQAWAEARRQSDFGLFRPLLEQIFALKRDEAAALGHTTCAYDPLLDEFEPEAKTADVRQTLSDLRDELVPLVGAIADAPRRPDPSLLARQFPVEAQRQVGRAAAEAIGFDFARGRLDETDHPFCSGLAPHDTRLTTRYDERHFSSALFGTLHEAGHGLYEQGLPAESFGLPTGQTVSLGVHESQSRMWENLVGRSRAFWEFFYPQVQAAFPAALGDVSRDDFYFAVNAVEPSLIRVEADEATYNLHILIRFELEQDLLDEELPVADLPDAWNEKYRHYLGITPPNDADGVLQDIHWSGGMVGYFPTYSLGNLHASQMYERAAADLGDLDALIARGEFGPLREWLRERVHQPARRYPANELIERISGAPLGHAALMRHLRGKLEPLYGLG